MTGCEKPRIYGDPRSPETLVKLGTCGHEARYQVSVMREGSALVELVAVCCGVCANTVQGRLGKDPSVRFDRLANEKPRFPSAERGGAGEEAVGRSHRADEAEPRP